MQEVVSIWNAIYIFSGTVVSMKNKVTRTLYISLSSIILESLNFIWFVKITALFTDIWR